MGPYRQRSPGAAFHADKVSGTAPLTVAFTDDTTIGTGPFTWTFGDSGTSTLRNPTHQDVLAGTYTVTLTVTGAGGSDVETKTSYITVSPGPVVPGAAFHSDKVSV